MRMPPLNALRAFEAAGRLGRIGAAAEELHVTHAAISHQVRRLEEWFGAALFRPEGRGVCLTAMGRELSECLSRDLGRIATTCTELRLRVARPALTVACIPSVATRWLIPRLDAFTRAHPEVRFQLAYAPAGTLPEPEAAEIVIRDLEGEGPSGFVRHDLLAGESRPVCSPAWLRRQGPIDEPADLCKARLLHDGDEQGWAGWFRDAGVRLGAGSLEGPIFQDFHLLSTAAIAGHGVALCPLALIGDELARGDLVQLFDIGANRERAYCMLHAPVLSTAGEAFRDWVIGLAAPDGTVIAADR